MRALLATALVLGLAACAGAPKKSAPPAAARKAEPKAETAAAPAARRKSPYAPAQEDPGKRGNYVAGGLYAPGVRDSVPDEVIDVDAIPEPEVTDEPRSAVGNRKNYSVLGKKYEVLDVAEGYVETGVASFYGNKFHGRRTSNLEVYDMYAFTAAHKTLPLPSFARVTNLDNGKSVIVRVNDRGPFHAGRIIDLSYAAATKLGYVNRGTARVEVRALTPRDMGDERIVVKADARPARRDDTKPSAMDSLVAAMPVAAAAAADVPGPRVAAAEHRFDMRQDGKTMSAAEFDAWMQSRQVRIATGRPGRPGTPEASKPGGAAAVKSEPLPAAASRDGRVFLQVASFAARPNADRALALLQGAGIDAASLADADANGQKVWRLRVGPLAAATVPDLAARIVGLGFGTPQRVRE
ncbi:septal ring lytic transglycosylase RlpA family protein [Lysobacter solisilvae (ex Woo and Kim 2020)]|uniref:Endolytic peptidoglycan transglycosylase RlpA n=1 Tax=Agrilutibacter terrestris TaxID=2865112 RepID=A0A7H0FUH8_9GAMM|nr:septal ring lytic transglycosylase RlpA family protein [Lysobacter terrestris]QNP39694.1 septal ring lytic transglycosylase RlpA family protein [Lysobacter terrestris]